MAVSQSDFSELLRRSDNKIGLCSLLAMAWLAASDGEVSNEEIAEIFEIARNSRHSSEVDTIIKTAEAGDLKALHVAAESLKQALSFSQRPLFLQALVGIALSDGVLRTGESHVIRFFADLFQISPLELDSIFHVITGRSFPVPGDTSRQQWWEDIEAKTRHAKQSRKNKAQGNPHSVDIRHLKALGVLGLDEDASVTEIKAAYRRLVQVHHPDKFSSLGAEAVEAASATFRRIKDAFDFLISQSNA